MQTQTYPKRIHSDRLRSVDSRPSYKIAKLVSAAFSPPLLIVFGLVLLAANLATSEAWFWTWFYIALVVILPCVYIMHQVRGGNITDFHMNIRAQRKKPLLLSLLCSVMAFTIMFVSLAPKMYLVFGAAGILQMALIFFVTLKWKISGHSTATAGFAVFLVVLYGQWAAPVLLTIPLVAWARIRLNRHEFLQTVVGTLSGTLFVWSVFQLIT